MAELTEYAERKLLDEYHVAQAMGILVARLRKTRAGSPGLSQIPPTPAEESWARDQVRRVRSSAFSPFLAVGRGLLSAGITMPPAVARAMFTGLDRFSLWPFREGETIPADWYSWAEDHLRICANLHQTFTTKESDVTNASYQQVVDQVAKWREERGEPNTTPPTMDELERASRHIARESEVPKRTPPGNDGHKINYITPEQLETLLDRVGKAHDDHHLAKLAADKLMAETLNVQAQTNHLAVTSHSERWVVWVGVAALRSRVSALLTYVQLQCERSKAEVSKAPPDTHEGAHAMREAGHWEHLLADYRTWMDMLLTADPLDQWPMTVSDFARFTPPDEATGIKLGMADDTEDPQDGAEDEVEPIIEEMPFE